MDHNEARLQYAALVATIQEAELKGAKMPYTSMNGNMYSYLGENGVALRLPKDAREEFLATYQTTLYHAYGIIQQEYVTVPPDLLAKLAELGPYFQVSFAYAKTLKPKAPSAQLSPDPSPGRGTSEPTEASGRPAGLFVPEHCVASG